MKECFEQGISAGDALCFEEFPALLQSSNCVFHFVFLIELSQVRDMQGFVSRKLPIMTI